MWFGTSQGLNVYDSRHIRTYLSDDSDTTSLSGSAISALLSDSRGTLWAGTSTGLNLYNPKTDKFRRILKNASPTSISDNEVNCIYEDKKGRIWVGTKRGLSLLTSREKGTFQNFFHSDTPGTPGIKNVRALYEEEEGIFWIGCTGGLFRLSFRDGSPAYEEIQSSDIYGRELHDLHITTITADRDKNIWVGTRKRGLYKWHRGKKQFRRYPTSELPGKGPASDDIRQLLLTRDGSLWIGTFEGICILNPQTSKFTTLRHSSLNPSSLGNNSIYAVFQDKAGSVWIGTYHKGISVVHDLVMPFHQLKAGKAGAGLNNEVVSALLEDSGQRLWIGTQGGGLNCYNYRTGEFRYYTIENGALASNHIQSLLQDDSGYIWASTHRGGLIRIDPENGQIKNYRHNPLDPHSLSSDEIPIIQKDSRGRIWATTEADGINVLNPATGHFDHININSRLFKLDNPYVRSLFIDSGKNVWIGTVKHMQVFNSNGKLIKTLPLPFVQVIYEDSKKNIWFGNRMNNSLARYRPAEGTIRSYSQHESLSGDDILGILEDDKGLLWLTTDNGLACLDPESGTVRNYSTIDGIASNTFKVRAAFRGRSGDFFLGTDEGVVYFKPSNVAVNHNPPKAVFADLKLFNKPVIPGDPTGLLTVPVDKMQELTFRHFQDIFTVDFAGLSYVKQEKNKYAYKLEGLEQQWNFVPVPSATYTNLEPGNYTLWVKVANNDGIWGLPRGMRISVLPPWWRTWWAYTLYGLLLALLAFFIVRFFWLRAMLRYEHALYHAKIDFFTNIAHDVRSHITLILGPVELILSGKFDENKVRSRLGSVKSNGERLLRLVNELLDFRKAEISTLFLQIRENELVSFLHNILSSFSDLSETSRITTRFTASHDRIFAPFDPEQLEKVIFNLLVNAYKFTPEGGTIELNVSSEASFVSIEVRDSGKGIAPEHLKNLFVNFFQVNELGKKNNGFGIGLALSKKIVDQHGGSLTVKSIQATDGRQGGTIFTIHLPKTTS